MEIYDELLPRNARVISQHPQSYFPTSPELLPNVFRVTSQEACRYVWSVLVYLMRVSHFVILNWELFKRRILL